MGDDILPTVMGHHDISKGKDHWLNSPKREEVFGQLGVTNIRTFVNPDDPTKVGLVMDVPDMDVFAAAMQSEAAAEAMEHDGVLPETLVILAATPAFAGVKGNYDLGIDGNLVGTMTISKHHVFSDVSGGGVTDSGTWAKAKHENAITLTITSSSYPYDVGCVLSGTVVAKGVNTASSPGSYACPNGPAGPYTGTWYAVKSGASGAHENANGFGPSYGFAR
jgi:hypothetical protein